MREIHERLRSAIAVARESVHTRTESVDLLTYCWGFCAALTGHHEGEDVALFPAVTAAHPELVPVVAKLVQDHDMNGALIQGLESALRSGRAPEVIEGHLDGLEAIMESHFRYEERELMGVLQGLELGGAVPTDVFGPL